MAEAKINNGLRARLHQVQTTLKRVQTRVQSEGERVMDRLTKDAGDLIGKDRKKAVQDLLAQAQKLRSDLQKRAERAVKDLEERGQKIVAAIEKQAEKSVEPIVRGLNLPTREEVDKLKKKVAQLEKRLHDWYAAVERYPRQLHEIGLQQYLEMKRRECLRQQSEDRSAKR